MIIDGAKFSEEEINWDFLVKNFNEKYIPEVVRDQLAPEFQELKQGQMSVTHDNKFTQLSRYAWGLVRKEAE